MSSSRSSSNQQRPKDSWQEGPFPMWREASKVYPIFKSNYSISFIVLKKLKRKCYKLHLKGRLRMRSTFLMH
jgi:hypothetical protein